MSQSPLSPTSPAPVGSEQFLSATSPHRDKSPMRRRSILSIFGLLLLRLWRLITVNRKVTLGSAIVGFFTLVAIVGPIVIRQNPLTYTLDLMSPPSSAHWLGTNQGGQDVFIQLVIGTRTSLFWALLTGLIVVFISVAVGLVSGYFGGIIDDVLSLITNVFLVIPGFPLAIVAVEYFSRNTLTIALVVALTNWPWGARVLRAQTFSMRNREFVTAALSTGEHTWRIMFREIFPNEISIVAASFITTTIQVLLAVAGLEFLGFGNSATVSWGTMLYGAYTGSALFQGAWWWFAPPGLCIVLLGSGLALLNFGIDEIADPRLRPARLKKDAKRNARRALAKLAQSKTGVA